MLPRRCQGVVNWLSKGVKVSGCQGDKVSGSQGVRVAGWQGVRICKHMFQMKILEASEFVSITQTNFDVLNIIIC